MNKSTRIIGIVAVLFFFALLLRWSAQSKSQTTQAVEDIDSRIQAVKTLQKEMWEKAVGCKQDIVGYQMAIQWHLDVIQWALETIDFK